MEVNVPGVGGSDRMYTVTRLHPASAYTLTIAAINTNGQRGPNVSINVTTDTPESKSLTCAATNHIYGYQKLLQSTLSMLFRCCYSVTTDWSA